MDDSLKVGAKWTENIQVSCVKCGRKDDVDVEFTKISENMCTSPEYVCPICANKKEDKEIKVERRVPDEASSEVQYAYEGVGVTFSRYEDPSDVITALDVIREYIMNERNIVYKVKV